ncbi:MAG: 2-polyprenyl-6-methoxyphenol hydroxylase [SAR86 cluster bacterium]|uniref:2-polyprenyl-6-methoxyphenol hydroxylase n=1 Tax=SAR86 cluster bacterium TaxID=2030880 RepID=A0A2A5C7S0_9GAMM|nr:MAG: 2-polyprenyl-6-methoxyphenol hydroxylase [SAR86 cluster bacterium]
MKEANILIVGGGIGGLTSAIALRRQGFNVDVIEKDPDWAVYGVGIIQQANVVREMGKLDLIDEYLSVSFPFDMVKIFNPDGTLAVEIPTPKLAGDQYPSNIGVSRPALHKVLGDRTKKLGANVFLGVTVDKFFDDGAAVLVDFSDGRQQSYDLVIGADGLYSKTRTQIFPEQPSPEFTGQSVWRYNFPLDPNLDCLNAYEGRNGIGLVPLADNLMYMYLVTHEPDNPWMDVDGLAEKMRDRMEWVPPTLAHLREQITDDKGVVYKPLQTIFIRGPWHKGRITLLGDAAHATTPHLGQGAGMAIEDSIVLAEELVRAESVEEAFSAYKARRFERCKFIVENSIAFGDYQMGKRDDISAAELTRLMFEVTSEPI